MCKPKHVVNVSGGSGSLEIACVAAGVPCTTIAWNEQHSKYLSMVIDQGIVKYLMSNPKFKDMCQGNGGHVRKQIESLFPIEEDKLDAQSSDSSSE